MMFGAADGRRGNVVLATKVGLPGGEGLTRISA
jgi:hypothetical protein